MLCYTWVVGTRRAQDDGDALYLYLSLGVIALHTVLFMLSSYYWNASVVELLVKLIYECEVGRTARKEAVQQRGRPPRLLQRLSEGYYKIIENTKNLLKGTPKAPSKAAANLTLSQSTNATSKKRLKDGISIVSAAQHIKDHILGVRAERSAGTPLPGAPRVEDDEPLQLEPTLLRSAPRHRNIFCSLKLLQENRHPRRRQLVRDLFRQRARLGADALWPRRVLCPVRLHPVPVEELLLHMP